MGFFSIYIRNCTQSGDNITFVSLGGETLSRLIPSRGLDTSVIQTFPTMIYSEVKHLKIGIDALECAVCLNEFEDNETLRLLPKCDHVFHPECIDEWLASHTTCPVCRANLEPQPGEPITRPVWFTNVEPNIDARREGRNVNVVVDTPEVVEVNVSLNRNRTRGSRSSRTRKFSRSHSTGHSLVQPGENTDRFTLKLPVEIRKQVMNRKLNRATSMVVLPRESSLPRGYRTGGEGSSRGRNYKRIGKPDRIGSLDKSDRQIFSMMPPFLGRESPTKSQKEAAAVSSGEEMSSMPAASMVDSVRPAV